MKSVQWNHKIFNAGEENFEALALEIFRFQAENAVFYKEYLKALNIAPKTVRSIYEIPFLPIRFFKTNLIQSGLFLPQAIFESSGTTGSVNSLHLIRDLSLYEESFKRAFELVYGRPRDWCIIGLLPSYLERKNSSLVYMVNKLIGLSGHRDSGFYLDEYQKLGNVLQRLEKEGQQTLLIGVSFALLDFAELFKSSLKHTIIMETGGMKGRREEMVRPALHQVLQEAFGVPVIHSEYGMTELLSQAYSQGHGVFQTPPWMKVLIRDEEDPFLVKSEGNGILNIIDLANVHSCSFIATDDIGRIDPGGNFEVQGRVDGSDLRGCALMVSSEV